MKQDLKKAIEQLIADYGIEAVVEVVEDAKLVKKALVV